jgi:hypothetical protein
MTVCSYAFPPCAPQLAPGAGGADVKVNVVGDTHGQLHDVLRLIQLAGTPSPTNWQGLTLVPISSST